jgi:hypothetical protein
VSKAVASRPPSDSVLDAGLTLLRIALLPLCSKFRELPRRRE